MPSFSIQTVFICDKQDRRMADREKLFGSKQPFVGGQVIYTGGLEKMSDFSGATLMITGGTGSFGSTVLKHFLQTDIRQIRIFSRDEKKQDDMRHSSRLRSRRLRRSWLLPGFPDRSG